MKITLTGASGRLGAIVCRKLVEAGHDVHAVDKVYRADLPARIEVVDLLQREHCYRLLDGAEALVHLANHPNAQSGDPQRVFGENMTMNMNIFQAAAHLGVKHVVFASSVQVLSGPLAADETGTIPAYLPLDGNAPAHPGNTYALSKALTESMLAYFVRQAAPLRGVAIRFPGIMHRLGPNNRIWAPPSDAHLLKEGFAFLHAEDAASLVAVVVAADLPGFRTYFPSARGDLLGKPTPDLIRELYPNVPLRKPLEQIDSLVDLSALERETGWSPQVPIHRVMPTPHPK